MKNQLPVFGVLLLLLVSFSAQAVLQYRVEVIDRHKLGKKYAGQAIVTITEGGSLWMMTPVDTYKGAMLPDLGLEADMTEGNYGWMSTVDHAAFSGTGDSDVMYFSDGQAKIGNTVYFVGNFETGDEIGVWLSDIRLQQAGHSLGPVGEGANAGLVKRTMGDSDLQGFDIFDYRFLKVGDIDFVLVGANHYEPIGQPLPGVMASMLLAGGTGAMLLRKKRRQRN